MAALSPLFLALAVRSRRQYGRVLERRGCLGRDGVPFQRLYFSGSGSLVGLASWVNVLVGDMALVGPRPLEVAEASAVPPSDALRFAVRPGLVSPYRVLGRMGVAYGTEAQVDGDYVRNRTLGGDLRLLLQWLVAVALGSDATPEAPETVNLFGVPIANVEMDEALEWAIASAASDRTHLMAFVNADCLNIAWKTPAYRDVLRSMDRVFGDGIGVRLGGRILKQPVRGNVNGTDLFPLLCESAARAGLPIYLLGARPGIAAAAAETMVRRFADLKVAGTRDGYFDPAEEESVVDAIRASGARILLVAMGAPHQELWLSRWKERLSPRLCMGVGGLFDFYSGRIPRAPLWMRQFGLEWVYRLMQEPGRMWRRYLLGNPLFLFRVWRQSRHPEQFSLPGGFGVHGEPAAPARRSPGEDTQ